MSRAAIFIGVDRTGGLPKLSDAAAGAKRMADEWARKQPMSSVRVLTDERKPVTAAMIKKAVGNVVDPRNLEQLIIYFSGHGVNLLRHEYWLLSGAQSDSQESINVAGSEDLARYCGVPHVVFISDACRTAAQGIGMQSFSGSEMFRPIDPNIPRNPVDQFYACKLGAPANEIPDPNTTTREYRAAYTSELLPALIGNVPEVIEWMKVGRATSGLIRPWPLQDYLEKAMANRLADPKLKTRVIQVPDADIASRPTAWISRVKGTPPRSRGRGRATPSTARLPLAMRSLSVDALATTIRAGRERLAIGPNAALVDRKMSDAARDIAAPFGPMHQESRCGFKIRGARVVEAFARQGRAEMSNVPADIVRVWDVRRPGTDALLVLDDGSCVVLPAIPEFLATLTFRMDELADVAYEPSEFTERWDDFRGQAPELRILRGYIASASSDGAFRLRGEDAGALARRMQRAKGVAPSLAIYAAYAYSDQHRFDLLKQMGDFQRRDLGGTFFDVAMLDHRIDRTGPLERRDVLAPFPLLAQGWAYVKARGIRLSAAFEGKNISLQQSLWTKFAPETTSYLKSAFLSEDFE